jgi:hypothetical protein
MINNITTATTSKISITILSCINNMISCTSTINRVISKVRYGNISFTGAGASNVVERIGGDQGDVRFTGVGAYNKVSNSAKSLGWICQHL